MKNPLGDIYRANWSKQARAECGYPEESRSDTIARLEKASEQDNGVGVAARAELARITKPKGAKRKGANR